MKHLITIAILIFIPLAFFWQIFLLIFPPEEIHKNPHCSGTCPIGTYCIPSESTSRCESYLYQAIKSTGLFEKI